METERNSGPRFDKAKERRNKIKTKIIKERTTEGKRNMMCSD